MLKPNSGSYLIQPRKFLNEDRIFQELMEENMKTFWKYSILDQQGLVDFFEIRESVFFILKKHVNFQLAFVAQTVH